MFSVRGPKAKYFAAAIAVLCILVGAYLSLFHSAGFVKTTAAIVSLTENPKVFDKDETTYTVTVEYDVDGTRYRSVLDSYSSSYKEGKSISVLYDPNDPTVVHGSDAMGIYVLALGIAILAVLVLSAVKTKQARQAVGERQAACGGAEYAPSVKGEERELYFLTDMGTTKVGHRIEDGERRVLYEAKMTKFSLAAPYGFDFIDHEHGRRTPHLVGHEEETKWNSFLLDNHYTFELDGEDVWQHLKRSGISVETERKEGTVWPRWRIFRDGGEIALLESGSQYIHEEDAEQHAMASKLAVRGFYRIWTREENLDVVFVVALAFARSGALNDEGGTVGKNLRAAFKKETGRH